MTSWVGEHVLSPEPVEKYCAAPPMAEAWRELRTPVGSRGASAPARATVSSSRKCPSREACGSLCGHFPQHKRPGLC